jgi:hypothetical protein
VPVSNGIGNFCFGFKRRRPQSCVLGCRSERP